MIVTCPHCQKKLKPSVKIEDNLRGLGSGKSLRISCPQCAGSILLDAGMLDSDMPLHGGNVAAPAARTPVTPPPPPDLSALNTSQLEGKVMVEDIPKVLILMPDSSDYRLVTSAMEALGYQPCFAESAEEAMEKMQFIAYASVILHSGFEEGGFEKGKFHHFMRAMNMHKRRFIFYILIGPEFHTLYDLQALACSANLVVNDSELAQLAIILRTAIPQYEAMFGAIMQEINALG
jgi:CheY-like chemotaxis protein